MRFVYKYACIHVCTYNVLVLERAKNLTGFCT